NYVSKISDVGLARLVPPSVADNIITAKPPMGLAHHVKKAVENDQIEEILDPVVTDWPVEEALSFAKLALSCTELSKKDRPNLATVVLPELNRLRDLGDTDNHVFTDTKNNSHTPRPPMAT
ncbi:U-box domain-containing protein, partial [Trifolium medium]|nr:U-box domain-containing protein [Trifolium medium]